MKEMTPSEVMAFARENDCRFVDLKFVDLPGSWKHFTVPIEMFSESTFEDGMGIDASSIRGWQPIHTSDMLALPDPNTAVLDPFMSVPMISMVCYAMDPITKEYYTRDPRHVAYKAENYLRSTGLGDTAQIGPEAEFFIFDSIQYESTNYSAFYSIDSTAGAWNTGRDERPNLGYKPRWKEGYFPVPPVDKFQDLRTEMVLEMQKVGIEVECQHHEVATAGQSEIDMKYDQLLRSADKMMWFKYIVKNVAYRNGRTATFMPKPIFEDNGSGMHTHISIWKGGKNLFAGEGYAGMSEMALHFIGGLLTHAPALCAFCNPTTNSYKRLVPGFEAPVNLAYSSRNRSAAIRIPMYSASPASRRVEYRPPDPSCNAYLAFSALLMAGLDGVERGLDPGDPLDKDIYGLTPTELADVPSTPGSLEDAMTALRNDHEFLLKGDVFTEDLIETWIEIKTESEINPVRMRPVPYEFSLYYDV